MSTGTWVAIIVGLAVVSIAMLITGAIRQDTINTPQTAEERVFMAECLKHQGQVQCKTNLEEMRAWSSN